MRLTTGTGVKLDDPTPDQIREVLSGLPPEGDNFAIYERDGMTYVQVVGDADTGFMAEYQIGSTSQHYRAADTAIPLEAIVEIMLSFARDDGSYLSMQTWELDETVGVHGGGCGAPAAAMLVLVLAVLVSLTCLPGAVGSS
jgi:hypothetical protein